MQLQCNLCKTATKIDKAKILVTNGSLFDRGDYHSLSRDIRETDWESLKSNDIDIYASNITNHISKLADKHIPNKKVKIRQSNSSCSTNEAKKNN